MNALLSMMKLRVSNAELLIIGYIDINSIRSKFKALVETIGGNMDIITIARSSFQMGSSP